MNNNLVFFSPIGRSDPCRGNYDGPFLHIIRHYKPKKVYIFLTKEMCEYDEKDNRYEIAAKEVDENIEIIKIKHPEIEKANDFLIFDEPFKKSLNKINKENSESEIIVNVTSGTPQMQATLYVLSTQAKFKTRLIQVGTYKESSNDAKPVDIDNDIKKDLENLYDNYEELSGKNRCIEIRAENVRKTIMSEIIISHIQSYDYNAALNTAVQAKALFDDRLINMLKAAAYRINLNIKRAEKYSKIAQYDIYPIKTSNVKMLFEYILYLQVKLKKGELAEFARGVSPCLTDLFDAYIEKVFKLNLKNNFCIKKGSRYILTKNKMPNEYQIIYDEEFIDGFKDGDVSAANLLPLLKYLCDRNFKVRDKEIAIKLREFEKGVRNFAAHNIISITEETFNETLGMSPNKIMDMIKELFETAFKDHKAIINWNNYDEMNEDIIEVL